jgi:TolA-binding protein
VLALGRGRVALDVEHLDPGESLTVLAGGVEARVIGTVFAVSRESARVTVDVVEGTVGVTTGEGPSLDVGAGKRLVAAVGMAPTMGDLAAEDRATVVALLAAGGITLAGEGESGDLGRDAGVGGSGGDLVTPGTSDGGRERSRIDASLAATGGEPIDAWRKLVASGRFIEAEGELTDYLESHPEDVAAWSLLADCRRKSGRWSDAVAAYLEVIDRGGRSEADRARYKAGVILQDRLGDHVAAARLFGEYLDGASGGALKPDAMLRRARSLVALGRGGEAKSLLERIVAAYPDLAAAESARRMLEEQNGVGEGPEGLEQPTQ